MPTQAIDSLTLEDVDALTLDALDQLVLNEGYEGVQSSKLLFKNRLFAGRLFAASLWRGAGEAVEVVTGIPARARFTPSGIGLGKAIGCGPGRARATSGGDIGLARALEN